MIFLPKPMRHAIAMPVYPAPAASISSLFMPLAPTHFFAHAATVLSLPLMRLQLGIERWSRHWETLTRLMPVTAAICSCVYVTMALRPEASSST